MFALWFWKTKDFSIPCLKDTLSISLDTNHITLCVWKYSTRSKFLFSIIFLFHFSPSALMRFVHSQSKIGRYIPILCAYLACCCTKDISRSQCSPGRVSSNVQSCEGVYKVFFWLFLLWSLHPKMYSYKYKCTGSDICIFQQFPGISDIIRVAE